MIDTIRLSLIYYYYYRALDCFPFPKSKHIFSFDINCVTTNKTHIFLSYPIAEVKNYTSLKTNDLNQTRGESDCVGLLD